MFVRAVFPRTRVLDVLAIVLLSVPHVAVTVDRDHHGMNAVTLQPRFLNFGTFLTLESEQGRTKRAHAHAVEQDVDSFQKGSLPNNEPIAVIITIKRNTKP